jgi:predicted amidophosphoribosyltransferase
MPSHIEQSPNGDERNALMQLAAPVRQVVSGIAATVMETLFPPLCAVCRTETGAAATLCPDCWPEIAFLGRPACAKCGRPQPGAEDAPDLICDDCLRLPRAWNRGAAALYYAGPGAGWCWA